MPKMHQNTLAGRAPPGPAGESLSAPQTTLSSRNQVVCTSNNTEKVAFYVSP